MRGKYKHNSLKKQSLLLMSDGHKQGLEKFRALVGLKPIKIQERECLRCEREFISEGNANRMCPHCSAYSQTLNESSTQTVFYINKSST